MTGVEVETKKAACLSVAPAVVRRRYALFGAIKPQAGTGEVHVGLGDVDEKQEPVTEPRGIHVACCPRNWVLHLLLSQASEHCGAHVNRAVEPQTRVRRGWRDRCGLHVPTAE
eukprot:6575767-Prymnesium_polylepis.1